MSLNISELRTNRCWEAHTFPTGVNKINPLNAGLNPICHLLVLLAHHIFHVSGLRVKLMHKPYDLSTA